MDHDSANALVSLIAGGVGLAVLILVALFTVFFVWLFWRIFQKAGYNGALGLLCLVPSVGPLICLLILAFGTWPNEVQPPPVIATTGVTPAVQ